MKTVATLAGLILLSLVSTGFDYKGQDGRLTIQPTPSAPLVILSATQDAEGMTVEVQNQSDFVVEYFELHSGHSRVTRGRDTRTERITKRPGFELVEPLSIAPHEIQSFRFPLLRDTDGRIYVDAVLMANGKGWNQGVWLKRLDEPKLNGMLWGLDQEENTRRGLTGVPVKISKAIRRDTPKGFSFTPARAAQEACYQPYDYIYWDCTEGPGPDPGGCGYFGIEWQWLYPNTGGRHVDFYTLADCYYPFETQSCGSNFRAVATNNEGC